MSLGDALPFQDLTFPKRFGGLTACVRHIICLLIRHHSVLSLKEKLDPPTNEICHARPAPGVRRFAPVAFANLRQGRAMKGRLGRQDDNHKKKHGVLLSRTEYHVLEPCTGTMSWYHVLVLCTGTMYWYHVPRKYLRTPNDGTG